MLTTVHSQNDDLVTGQAKIDCVRKAPEDRPARFAVDLLERQGILGHS